MFYARIFICHNVDLDKINTLESQIFQQLRQRLQESGAEIVSYPGRPAEEAFLAFVYQQLATCEWFLVFQTPEITDLPSIHTAVNIAQERVGQGQMQGILRFLMQADELQEAVPEWAAIPTIGATYDYPRAIEKLLLALSLNYETTAKEDSVPPPPPTAIAPLFLSAYDTPHYEPGASEQTFYHLEPALPYSAGTVYNQSAATTPYTPVPQLQAVPQIYSDPTYDRPVPLARMSRLKNAYAATPRIVLFAPLLAIALILGFLVLVSPLQALVASHQNNTAQVAGKKTATTGTGIEARATPAAGSTVGVLHPGPHTTPGGSPKSPATPAPAPTTAGQPVPTPTAATGQPAPTPTRRPAPTPTPKPPVCPATIQNGSTGALVKTLQNELNARGMKGSDGKALTVDGDFGANTEHAVKSWQTAEQIEVDGQVGPITWHTLGNC